MTVDFYTRRMRKKSPPWCVMRRTLHAGFSRVMCRALSLAVSLVMAWPLPALAHGLRVAVQSDSVGLVGRVSYSDGSAAHGERVDLHVPSAAAQPTHSTVTDADGRFRFEAPDGQAVRVVAWGDEGHRAETQAVWTAPGAAPSAGTSTSTAASPALSADVAALVARAVRDEVQPLRDDVARLDQRTRLADLVAGLGLIVGLAGAIAWWRARRPA